MELINSRREDDDIVMIEPDADAVDPEQTKPSKEKEPEPLTVPRVAATKVDLGWPNMEQATSATHAKLLEQQQTTRVISLTTHGSLLNICFPPQHLALDNHSL